MGAFRAAVLVAAGAMAALLQSVAWAATPGDLDPGFDTDGMTTVSTGSPSVASEAVLSGGKILGYGTSGDDLLLFRLLATARPTRASAGATAS